MDDRLILAAVVVAGVPAALVGYLALVEALLGPLPGPARLRLRPWLWLAPAAVFLLVFLVSPGLNTLYLSFFGPDSVRFVGLENYRYVFTDGNMLGALRNNAIWLVLFTLLTVTLGLLIAVLADRVPYEAGVKAL